MRGRFHNTVLLLCLLQIFVCHNIRGQENKSIEELRDLIYEYGLKGWRNVEFNLNLDTAELYLKEALKLQYNTPGYQIDDRVAINHINLASVYGKIHNNSQALYHLNLAEEVVKNWDPNSVLFGSIYNNKGNIIKKNNDVYRTKEYYEYALDWLTKAGQKNSEDFFDIYSNYISILLLLNESDLAIKYLAEINADDLSISENLKFDFAIMKAQSFGLLKKDLQAENHYENAKKILDKGSISNYDFKAYKYYFFYIDYLIEKGLYSQAYSTIAEAQYFIESFKKYSANTKTSYYATFQYYYAIVLNEEAKFNKALDVINNVIKELDTFFENQPLKEINASITNQNTYLLPELNTLKSKVLYNIFLESNQVDDLLSSYNSYKLSIEMLNNKKLSIQNEESKFFATEGIIEVYNEAIYVGNLLYEISGEMKYLEKAFEFSESSKSFALYSEIKDVEVMEFSDLPADIRDQEQRLISEIKANDELLNEELLTEVPDSSNITFLEDKLFHLRDDYNDLMQDIEKNNAKYFEFKYNPKFVSLEEVKNKLAYKDALIEYVLTDTLLITYVVDNKGINVITQEIGPEFSSECLEYYQIMHTQNFSKGVYENYKRFVTLGRKFYRILVEPCLEYTDRKNLTIVPDGAITYLSFESLLTEDAEKEYINYLNLPYMILDYSVGYSHSSTLLFGERLKSKSPEKMVLAFAPRYKDVLMGNDTAALFRQVMSEAEILLPLGGVIKEVQSINETVPSKIFLNEAATEANFKKHAADYNVLHLAMHTIMKDDNPLHSLLAFTNINETDSVEDNRLYAYEIYNMKLNAQMAVLSSCSSGFGKMQKGEGMMSLARGFIYAGCPSIVMTLWQVADQSSSELMTSFYKYLKKGKSKQEAMRLAKIDYLDSADDLTSNPYFWSGFVVVGDNSPIYKRSGMVYWISIILLFVGILAFFQIKKS